MNIKKLKEIIAKLPDDMQVWTSSDEEGNRFDPVADISVMSITEYDEETDEHITVWGFEDYSFGPEDQVLMIWP